MSVAAAAWTRRAVQEVYVGGGRCVDLRECFLIRDELGSSHSTRIQIKDFERGKCRERFCFLCTEDGC